MAGGWLDQSGLRPGSVQGRFGRELSFFGGGGVLRPRSCTKQLTDHSSVNLAYGWPAKTTPSAIGGWHLRDYNWLPLPWNAIKFEPNCSHSRQLGRAVLNGDILILPRPFRSQSLQGQSLVGPGWLGARPCSVPTKRLTNWLTSSRTSWWLRSGGIWGVASRWSESGWGWPGG